MHFKIPNVFEYTTSSFGKATEIIRIAVCILDDCENFCGFTLFSKHIFSLYSHTEFLVKSINEIAICTHFECTVSVLRNIPTVIHIHKQKIYVHCSFIYLVFFSKVVCSHMI